MWPRSQLEGFGYKSRDTSSPQKLWGTQAFPPRTSGDVAWLTQGFQLLKVILMLIDILSVLPGAGWWWGTGEAAGGGGWRGGCWRNLGYGNGMWKTLVHLATPPGAEVGGSSTEGVQSDKKECPPEPPGTSGRTLSITIQLLHVRLRSLVHVPPAPPPPGGQRSCPWLRMPHPSCWGCHQVLPEKPCQVSRVPFLRTFVW